MGETNVPMLYFPLSDREIIRIRKGGDVRKHYHLPPKISTLLVVVATSKRRPIEFEDLMRRGISVTSIALTEEALQNIEESGCTEAQYANFRIVIGSVETFRKLGKMK